MKRSELHTFKVLLGRRIVERSFGRPDKCRRLWKNCERKLHTSYKMVVFAFIAYSLKELEQALRADQPVSDAMAFQMFLKQVGLSL